MSARQHQVKDSQIIKSSFLDLGVGAYKVEPVCKDDANAHEAYFCRNQTASRGGCAELRLVPMPILSDSIADRPFSLFLTWGP